jgi:peptidyl-prolyl cis-trans isomerase B (cyclophilin B)
VSPSTRERDNARRRQEAWRARQQQQREAALARRRRLLAVVAGGLAALLVVAGVVAVVRGGDDGGSAATASATPERTAPDPSVAEGRTWTAAVATSQGQVGLELDGAAAPAAVASFVTLAQEGYFDGTTCHRLVTEGIFVLQCGDPEGTGTGGPGYGFGPVENDPADDLYPAGTLAMARRGGDGSSMGSQFFVVYRDSTIPSDAAGGYTVFGQVTSGLDVVEAVAQAGVDGGRTDGAPATPISLEQVSVQ